MSTTVRRRARRTLTSTQIGLLLVVMVLSLFVVLFSKDKIATTLMSGETVTVRFDRAYKIRPHVSEVKVAFVPVGKVISVERDGDDAVVQLKVDGDVLDHLGSEPSATIRPTTLLGGSYFVDLAAGGDPGPFRSREIPEERTALPVELDKVARTLQPEALTGMRSAISQLDGVLSEDGDAALDRLLAATPRTLDPAGRVLSAAQGYRPSSDLRRIVSGLESTSRVLTRRQGQLDRIVTGLRDTAVVFGDHGPELAQSLAAMPRSLEDARRTLAGLDGTLTTLRDMSDDTRGIARALDSSLTDLGPALVQARQMLPDARAVVRDARPVMDRLVPSARVGTEALDDLTGPVLTRVNGPVMDWLYEAYDGKAPYSLTRSEKTMYQEITYTFVNLARASGFVDSNGHGVSFQPGIGSGSVGGLPVSFEQLFKMLTSPAYLDTPMNTIGPVSPSGSGDAPASTGLLDQLLGGTR